MSKSKKRFKVQLSTKEKVLAVLAILCFILTVAGVFEKHLSNNDTDSVENSAKKEKSWN